MRCMWLVGMMGSGKSVVGRLISHRMGIPLVDTDEKLTDEHGQPITSLWESAGERTFRDLEATEIARIAVADQDCVVATGGGAVLRPENVTKMRATGVVVWLTAVPEVLSARIGEGMTRPLLAGQSTEDRLAELLAERRPYYAYAAHQTVDTADKKPEEVAREVALLWNVS